jgi:phosphoglycolate phosphatase-like HAD superfamily hydrolase
VNIRTVNGGTWAWRAGVRTGRTVVFDVDGVLSDAAGRQRFLDGSVGKRDWNAFFAAAGEDPAIQEVHTLLALLDPQLAVVLLTARPDRVQSETLAWLDRYDVRWDLLVMRPARDPRSASDFKLDALEALRAAGLNPELAFEDDRRNADMFRQAGVPCVYIHSGYYD